MQRQTHSGVAPELGHLADPHGSQQGLPHFHLEHLSNKDLSRPSCPPAVIHDRAFKVVQQRLEMENQLGYRGRRSEKEKKGHFLNPLSFPLKDSIIKCLENLSVLALNALNMLLVTLIK